MSYQYKCLLLLLPSLFLSIFHINFSSVEDLYLLSELQNNKTIFMPENQEEYSNNIKTIGIHTTKATMTVLAITDQFLKNTSKKIVMTDMEVRSYIHSISIHKEINQTLTRILFKNYLVENIVFLEFIENSSDNTLFSNINYLLRLVYNSILIPLEIHLKNNTEHDERKNHPILEIKNNYDLVLNILCNNHHTFCDEVEKAFTKISISTTKENLIQLYPEILKKQGIPIH